MVPVHSQTDGENQMKEYRQSAKMLRAMAHPGRLQILEALVHGPACVCELIVKTGRHQACISQHLMLLRQTGLVKRTRIGLNMRYDIATESVRKILMCVLQDSNILTQAESTMIEKREVFEAMANEPITG